MKSFARPMFYGRMGNVLFQAATGLAYALDHGIELSVPNKTDSPKWNPIYLQHLVHPSFDETLPEIKVSEKIHPFHELDWKPEWAEGHRITLDGYWQTEKYFLHRRQQVLDRFGFKWQPLQGHVSVHVRRGDYLRLRKKHPPVLASWIHEAMDRFPGASFKFFSDDIPWCVAHFKSRPRCSFSTNTSEVDDLVEMSWHEHHICSCSTFSWWGAWLNRNPSKRVIMPKLWFVPGWGGLDVKDIVPEQWERV